MLSTTKKNQAPTLKTSLKATSTHIKYNDIRFVQASISNQLTIELQATNPMCWLFDDSFRFGIHKFSWSDCLKIAIGTHQAFIKIAIAAIAITERRDSDQKVTWRDSVLTWQAREQLVTQRSDEAQSYLRQETS